MGSTDRAALTKGDANQLGYHSLTFRNGEKHLARTDLAPARADPGDPLLTVLHLSDLHFCDAQSPGRGEALDRWGDFDSPLGREVGNVEAYRAQEMLTLQVGEAMVRAANSQLAGPVGGAPIDWAITTGDVVDSAQLNELGWYITMLEGGEVRPDSGSYDRWEGVADLTVFDPYFWHPDPSEELDRPRALHGFPDAPGLLDHARRPFRATGLAWPWLGTHGNHDQLIAGSIPAAGPFTDAGTLSEKAIGFPPDWTLQQIGAFLAATDGNRSSALDQWPELVTRPITPDPGRRPITRNEFLAAHLHGGARPVGHGFGLDAAATGHAYYRYDHSVQLTVLTLDTVNEFGGWQGSIDEAQFDWFAAELAAADAERRYVVIASHHTLADLVNGAAPEKAGRRILAEEFAALLDAHPCVIAWLNGHTHRTAVAAHHGRHGWWELTAPSLVDFPQQGRVVELLRSAGTLTIAATMIDHEGEVPWSGGLNSVTELAGLSRELAANAWQYRIGDPTTHPLAGGPQDRNVLLYLADPYA